MRKYISTSVLLLIFGFLIFNYSNRSAVVPPLTAALLCPPSCIPPTVSTSAASSLTKTEATLNGEIIARGGGNITQRGFEYGLTTSYGSFVMESPLTDAGESTFAVEATSLSCGKIYHYRTRATNSQNTGPTGFGSDVKFKTGDCVYYAKGRTESSSSTPSSSATSHSSGGFSISASSSSTSSSVTSHSSSVGSASASSVSPSAVSCMMGDKFSTATGLPCTTYLSPTICPMGDLFNTSTGLPCTSFEQAQTSFTITTSITDNLVFGSTGDEVKSLQAGLNKDGFESGPVDGIFGPITKSAVIRFQLAHGLNGDGIFGVNSKAAWDSR